MKKLLALTLAALSLSASAANFNATDNVDTIFRYTTEYFDTNGNLQAWSYFEVANTPWDPAHQYYAWHAARVCCGFNVTDIIYDPTDPIEFPWPVTLIAIPDIDPTWTAKTSTCVWSYDYPNYLVNGGYPIYLCDYNGGDIWADVQGGAIFQAFGAQPCWYPAPLAAAESTKTNRGKHLGQNK